MILNDIEKKFIDNPQCAFYFCVQKSKKGTRGLLMRLEGCKKEGSITTLYLQGFQYTLVQNLNTILSPHCSRLWNSYRFDFNKHFIPLVSPSKNCRISRMGFQGIEVNDHISIEHFDNLSLLHWVSSGRNFQARSNPNAIPLLWRRGNNSLVVEFHILIGNKQPDKYIALFCDICWIR